MIQTLKPTISLLTCHEIDVLVKDNVKFIEKNLAHRLPITLQIDTVNKLTESNINYVIWTYYYIILLTKLIVMRCWFAQLLLLYFHQLPMRSYKLNIFILKKFWNEKKIWNWKSKHIVYILIRCALYQVAWENLLVSQKN